MVQRRDMMARRDFQILVCFAGRFEGFAWQGRGVVVVVNVVVVVAVVVVGAADVAADVVAAAFAVDVAVAVVVLAVVASLKDAAAVVVDVETVSDRNQS